MGMFSDALLGGGRDDREIPPVPPREPIAPPPASTPFSEALGAPTPEPEATSEEGLFSKTLRTIDKPRAFVAKSIFSALEPGFEPTEDVVTGSNIIHALSQKIVTGPKKSASRSDPGSYKELEDIPESTIGKIADFGVGLTVDVLTDPLTYTGIGTMTRAGLAAKGGVRGAELAKTWGEQAAAGQRALVKFGGKTIIRGEPVFKVVSKLSAIIGDTGAAKETAQWMHRVFNTTIGLPDTKKALVEFGKASQSEQRHFLVMVAANAGKRESEINRLAARLGYETPEFRRQVLSLVDAPKEEVRNLRSLLDSGTLSPDEADAARLALGIAEEGAALFQARATAGAPVAELGREAFERDMKNSERRLARYERNMSKAVYAYARLPEVTEYMLGAREAAKKATSSYREAFDTLSSQADEAKKLMDDLVSGRVDKYDGVPRLRELRRQTAAGVATLDALRQAASDARQEAKILGKQRRKLSKAPKVWDAANDLVSEEEAFRVRRATEFNDRELSWIRHAMTPEALEIIAKRPGGGSTAEEKVTNLVSELRRRMKLGGKNREIALPVIESNKMMREMGVLPEGVNFFSEDPVYMAAVGAIEGAKAISAAKLLTRISKRFGKVIADPERTKMLDEMDRLSKAIASKTDERTMEALRGVYGAVDAGSLQRRHDAIGEKLIGMSGGLGAGEDASDALWRIKREVGASLPAGWERYHSGPLAGKMLPPDVADWVVKYQSAIDPETSRGFLNNVWRPVQSWWAAWSLSPRPSFVARNQTGNLWLNHLAGDVGVRDYIAAAMIQMGAREGRVAQAIKRVGMKLAGVGDEATGTAAGYSYGDIAEMASRGGVTKSSFFSGSPDAGEGLQKAISDAAGTTPIGVKDLIPFVGTKNNRILKMSMITNEAFEDNAKLAHLIGKLRAGYSEEAAIASVKKHLFDYQDLSAVERGTANRIGIKDVIPFYTFTRKSLPLHLESIISKPQKFGRIQQAKQELQGQAEGGTYDEGVLPKWVRDSMPIQLGKHRDKPGVTALLTLANYWPGQDLQKVSGLEQAAGTLLAMVTPFLKMPVEQVSDTNLFQSVGRGERVRIDRGAKVDFLGGRIHPRLAHLLRSLILVNELDRWNPQVGGVGIFGEGESPDAPHGRPAMLNLIPWADPSQVRLRNDPDSDPSRLTQYLTGVKLQEVDTRQEAITRKGEFRHAMTRLTNELRSRAHKGDTAGMEEIRGAIRKLGESHKAWMQEYLTETR